MRASTAFRAAVPTRFVAAAVALRAFGETVVFADVPVRGIVALLLAAFAAGAFAAAPDGGASRAAPPADAGDDLVPTGIDCDVRPGEVALCLRNSRAASSGVRRPRCV